MCVSILVDAVDGLGEHGAGKWFWPPEDDDPNAILLTPHDILPVGHSIASRENISKRSLRDPIFAHAILRMPAHRDVAKAGHIRKVVFHR